MIGHTKTNLHVSQINSFYVSTRMHLYESTINLIKKFTALLRKIDKLFY